MITDFLREPPIPLDELDLDELPDSDRWEPRQRLTPSWHDRGACRGQAPLMFDEERVEDAKALCRACPVARECLAFALDYEVTHGVWAGTTFEERTRICPVCQGPKEPSALGCDFGHNLLRLSRLAEQQEEGELDVRISLRQRPSARTNPECPVPRGMAHNTARAYRGGCRCEAAREEKQAERRYQVGASATPQWERRHQCSCGVTTRGNGGASAHRRKCPGTWVVLSDGS